MDNTPFDNTEQFTQDRKAALDQYRILDLTSIAQTALMLVEESRAAEHAGHPPTVDHRLEQVLLRMASEVLSSIASQAVADLMAVEHDEA